MGRLLLQSKVVNETNKASNNVSLSAESQRMSPRHIPAPRVPVGGREGLWQLREISNSALCAVTDGLMVSTLLCCGRSGHLSRRGGAVDRQTRPRLSGVVGMIPPGIRLSLNPRRSSRVLPRSRGHLLGSSLALVLAFATVGCESKSSTSTGPSPVKCQVSLEAPANTIDAGGGKDAITVSTQPECSWTASSGASWISGLTPASGQGSGRIEFQAAANPAGTMRQGDIAVNDQHVPVQQKPATCRYEVTPATQTVAAGGGTVTIAVNTLAGCSWQAAVEAGWIAITATSGTGSGDVSLRVDPNGGGTRSAALLVAGQTVTVTQSSSTPASPNCVFTLARSSEAVAAAGAAITVAVSGGAGCSRTATSEAPWITVVAGATGTGNGSVTFNVASNTGAARTGTVTIAGLAFTVTQAAAAAPPPPRQLLVFDCSEQPIHRRWRRRRNDDYDFDIRRMRVDGGKPGVLDHVDLAGERQRAWYRDIQRGRQQWRRAKRHLAIAGQTFTVNQAAAPPPAPSCSFSIAPNNQSIGTSGGNGVSVAVSTSAGCAWTAGSNDSWITLLSGANGNGVGAVTFRVASNTVPRQNVGTLTIAGRTFTVNQASGCTYSIDPKKQSIKENGGAGTPIAGFGGHGLRLDGHEQRLVDHDHLGIHGQRQWHRPLQRCREQRQEADGHYDGRRPDVHGRSGPEIRTDG